MMASNEPQGIVSIAGIESIQVQARSTNVWKGASLRRSSMKGTAAPRESLEIGCHIFDDWVVTCFRALRDAVSQGRCGGQGMDDGKDESPEIKVIYSRAISISRLTLPFSGRETFAYSIERLSWKVSALGICNAWDSNRNFVAACRLITYLDAVSTVFTQ